MYKCCTYIFGICICVLGAHLNDILYVYAKIHVHSQQEGETKKPHIISICEYVCHMYMRVYVICICICDMYKKSRVMCMRKYVHVICICVYMLYVYVYITCRRNPMSFVYANMYLSYVYAFHRYMRICIYRIIHINTHIIYTRHIYIYAWYMCMRINAYDIYK